ncbi:Uncharacterised protein [Mycobacterium tuberculosis]|nr:Uncharacterised protein [Mycobacterium tuberculosis]
MPSRGFSEFGDPGDPLVGWERAGDGTYCDAFAEGRGQLFGDILGGIDEAAEHNWVAIVCLHFFDGLG